MTTPRHPARTSAKALLVLVAALLAVPTALLAPAGAATTPPGDVEAQFAALKHHPEALGWRYPEDQGAPDPTNGNHFQGLARYPGAGTPVFYVTQKQDGDEVADKAGYLHVVRLGSRSGNSGERIGSNLQRRGTHTYATYPPEADTWARTIRFDDTLIVDGAALPAYVHPGSMAIADDVLFVPVDTPADASAPTGMIVLFDLSGDRERPVPIQALELDHGIDNLGVTSMPDGTYLIWTNGAGGKEIRLYRTTLSDLRDDDLDIDLAYSWDPNKASDYDGAGHGWPHNVLILGGAHQSSTFVSQAGGTLYLVAMRQSIGAPDTGDDFADLYQVTMSEAPFSFKLTRKSTIHQFCEDDGNGRSCNFAAANTAYVTPSGELILYSAPHDDEDDRDPDYVRMAEFRHQELFRPGSPLRSPSASTANASVEEGRSVTLSGTVAPSADRPWVELFDDTGFLDRSIFVPYDSRHLYELDNFDELDTFEDKPSAVRWRLPVGMRVRLHEDKESLGARVELVGTGRTEEVGDLDNDVVRPGVVERPGQPAGDKLAFGDEPSSMDFQGAPPDNNVRASWDLDGDAIFGETGAAAARGDETGLTPTFSAAGIDGPSTRIVHLRACDVGCTDTAATVTIDNADPVISGMSNTGPVDEGSSATVSVTASDPAGAADPLSYAFDCEGDGTFEVGPGTAASTTCAFADDGSFTVGARVTDGEGGTATATTAVSVANVAPTVISVTGPVDPVLMGAAATVTAAFNDPGMADAHSCTFAWDDGGTTTTVPAQGTGNGSCTGSRTFAEAGVYQVTVTVADGDGGTSAAAVFEHVIVVDPAGGFLTGAGAVTTPEGRAQVTFQSRYADGAATPSGQVQLRLKDEGLEIDGQAQQWLVVAGAKAQVRGTASVNGAGGFTYLLIVTDGDQPGGGGTDRLRLKVWNTTTGAVAFDNVPGAPDDIDTATPQALSAGSVAVHRT
ncbi:MAG TPA: PKD domain-containing protein [Acidimicrobiales bacterium]|nr:PKD domain-containing protein [Acidimicrobiales bacterium]